MAVFFTLMAILINLGWGIYSIITGELWSGLIAILMGTPCLYAQFVVFAYVLNRL